MTTDLKVKARLNHGRWLADCSVCKGAELVTPGQLFRCLSRPCTAVAEVEWPANLEKIEHIVAARPKPENRNWEPGESLAQLRAENQAHKVPALAPLVGQVKAA